MAEISNRDLTVTDELHKIFSDFKRKTTHQVTFYVKDQQYWFKNTTTTREYPLPIALIEAVTKTDERSEANRVARDELKRYVEGVHLSKSVT